MPLERNQAECQGQFPSQLQSRPVAALVSDLEWSAERLDQGAY